MAGEQLVVIREGFAMQQQAQRAMARAFRAMDLNERNEQRNEHVIKFGVKLASLGMFNIMMTVVNAFKQPEPFPAYPTHVKANIGFVGIAGFLGTAFGLAVSVMNNPARFRPVAAIITCSTSVAAALALGLFISV